MPQGQFLGPRKTYIYLSDGGSTYLITTDSTLGDLAGTGLTAAVGGNVGSAQTAPSRFKPRVVFWQGTLNGNIVRKKIICNRDSAFAKLTVSTTLVIDGVTGVITGRRGEKQSFSAIGAGGGDLTPGVGG